MSKNDFKLFARNNPELASSVANGQTTWQNLYELYDIYGEQSNVWDGYISRGNNPTNTTDRSVKNTEYTNNQTTDSSINGNTSISDVVGMIKNIDLETVQKGVTNLQKTIGLLQDFGIGSSTGSNTNIPKSYEARPIYKYFED